MIAADAAGSEEIAVRASWSGQILLENYDKSMS